MASDGEKKKIEFSKEKFKAFQKSFGAGPLEKLKIMKEKAERKRKKKKGLK